MGFFGKPSIAEKKETPKIIDNNINLTQSTEKKCKVYIPCGEAKKLINQVKEWLKTLDTKYNDTVSNISKQLVKKQEDVNTDIKINDFFASSKNLEKQMSDANVERTMEQKKGYIIKDNPEVKINYTDGKSATGKIINIKLKTSFIKNNRQFVVYIQILRTKSDGKKELINMEGIELNSLCIVEDCDIAIEADQAAQARATEKAIKTQLAIEVQNGGKLFKKHKKNRDGDNNIFVCE